MSDLARFRMSRLNRLALSTLFITLFCLAAAAESPASPPTDADARVHAYLARKVREIEQRSSTSRVSLAEWRDQRDELRRQLFDMLGLWPLPARSELQATITGQKSADGVIVEKLHFQSMPGLYVTANFYHPAEVARPLPTILYLCGHARAVSGGVSFGNKTAYHHHACWYARNGYCCLMIDTLQLGEILGLHHGTYRDGMWWWIARGYTPAGVEAWNAIRALDYLETRPEVDRTRFGVTGRSGGGAYSWYLAALDDRPACIVPVAGITNLRDHVVHRCIQGHCDCMFMINQYQWDFDVVAALVAPRPCLLANTDKDSIFPLDGVATLHRQLKRVYELYGAGDKLGLFISEGPHADTQELQLASFRWMNRWLRDVAEPVTEVASKRFEPQVLKALDKIPADERNTTIHESFVSLAAPSDLPTDLAAWDATRQRWLAELARRAFGAWPSDPPPLAVREIANGAVGNVRWRQFEFTSEADVPLMLWSLTHREEQPMARAVLHVTTDGQWRRQLGPIVVERDGTDQAVLTDATNTLDPIPPGELRIVFAPRGWGQDRWPEAELTHLLRSFVLVGTTADACRIWDARRAIQAVRNKLAADAPLTVVGEGAAAGIALYATIFEPSVAALRLVSPPTSHRDGPNLIKVLQLFDLPQALALAFPRPVTMIAARPADWAWTSAVARLYGSPPLDFESELASGTPARRSGVR
jgi:dienelactone hydrolase